MRMWQRISASEFTRHAHSGSYAALTLDGEYEEAGDLGRLRVRAGDVVLHERFEAHVDRFTTRGAVILNLKLPSGVRFQPGLGCVADPDAVVRSAEHNRSDAARMLILITQLKRAGMMDWPDRLAAALIENPSLCLAEWSAAHALKPWAVSRGFNAVFAITPARFRARSRARQGWKAIVTRGESLARIAAELGFADQAHMTRSVKILTGRSPAAWRSASEFKTQ
jgi:AraC-like DNA-binding protein